MENIKVLVVDDESRMRKLVKDFLTREGYTVLEAGDGMEAMDIFYADKDIALIILDVMMPKMDGWQVCREIRESSKVPIIMLTARSEERDELQGFELGVDEYISKPFSPKILVARVNAILRRTLGNVGGDVLEAGGIVLDKAAHIVKIDGESVDLSYKEFELLSYFIENQGIALSREKILNNVWNYDYFGDARTIDTHVKKLRSKLGEKGNLIKLAQENGFETFYIPDGVGGRFSELCPVGLVPAACCGIDIRALLAGAAAMDARCKNEDMMKNPALLEAVLQYIACEQMGRNVQVMMPYADSLKYMADWFCQLWAESLGKNVRRDGTPCHAGQTPAKALGVTDQQSQLQLYNEGPFDKVITFIKVENFRSETKIPKGCEQFQDVAFLGGMTHNTLIEAERQGTEYALYVNRRMNQTIIMPEVNAYTLGQLMFFLEMATAYEGELLDIDAFNQPGVETSKRATYAILGNTDAKYDAARREMTGRPAFQDAYIL